MNEDIVVPAIFFLTVIVLVLGIPIVRAWARQRDRMPVASPLTPVIDERLQRIEHAIDAMSLEVERIAEGQRFVTKLLAGRDPARAALPAERHEGP